MAMGYISWQMVCLDRRLHSYIRGHAYITSAKGPGGWVKKMVNFANVQYCIYADKVGGWGPKRPKYADVV